jgi:hypothetical protein
MFENHCLQDGLGIHWIPGRGSSFRKNLRLSSEVQRCQFPRAISFAIEIFEFVVDSDVAGQREAIESMGNFVEIFCSIGPASG